MTLMLQPGPLADVSADWLVVGLWEEEKPTGNVAELDSRLEGALVRLIQAGDVTGKSLELVPILNVRGIAATRLLIVGLGKRTKAERAGLHAAAVAVARTISTKPTSRVAFALPE